VAHRPDLVRLSGYVSSMERSTPIEHRQGRLGRLLRERRWQLVLWIVLVEGILVLFDAIPWWTVLVLAVLSFALYVATGRSHRNAAVREGTWIAAVSQLVVVLVPVLALVLTALAIVALVLVAIGVLALLLLDRR
jgi:hypothetical protein